MRPEPLNKQDEKEIVVGCSFIEAKLISEKMKKKFPDYDFWAVDSSATSGLYVGNGLDDKDFGFVLGYATCLLDSLNYLRGIE